MRKMLVVVKLLFLLLAIPFATVAGDVVATDVTATQRYPWNGLVDIVVTIHGSADDVASAECLFTATVSETGETIPVEHVTRNGIDSGSDFIWTRRLIWDAAADAGAVKINDIALTVDAKILEGVQLWENGPYWAECNIGATKPEGYGYYFWWGDTIGYTPRGGTRNPDGLYYYDVKWDSSQGDLNSYPFTTWACSTYNLNKSSLRNNGYIDSTGSLVAKYDAARVHCGAPWRMPTAGEFSALASNCTIAWIVSNNVNGVLVTGKGAYSSRSIFFPAAGWGSEDNFRYSGICGTYWSSTYAPYSYPESDFDKKIARQMIVDANGVHNQEEDRNCGLPVRPVRANLIGDALLGVTTHLTLDCRDGVRKISAQGENLLYDASWCAGASSIRITDNGKVIEAGTVGSCDWRPEQSCPTRHFLKLELLNGVTVSSHTSTNSTFSSATAPTSCANS